MTGVLVVNAGSSSLKVRVLRPDDSVAAGLDIDRWDGEPDHTGLGAFLTGLTGISAAGHRVVHGGARFTGPAVIDDDVLAGIGALAELAPLHQPRAVAGIRAVLAALPGVPSVACFDTAFHAGLPPAAASYALPAEWTRRFGLRKYGFHGLSHAYVSRRAAALCPDADPAVLRVVSCHLGAGASLAAVHGGRSVDTTMGFTPLAGLVMATRPGDVDPGLLVWLLQQGRLALTDLASGLEHASGLAGLAGLADRSGDLRDIRRAAAAGQRAAALAIDVHQHRLRGQIAAMAAAMNGLDVLAFTGGIGEHDGEVRADAAASLGYLGVAVDAAANAAASPAAGTRAPADHDITAAGAAIRTLVIAAREDAEIARQVRAVLG